MMLSSYGPVEDVINLADGAHQTPLHRSAYQLVTEAASKSLFLKYLYLLHHKGCSFYVPQ